MLVFDIPSLVSFQDPASSLAELMILFHSQILFLLIFIFVLVTWLLYAIVAQTAGISLKFMTHGPILELIWTLSPAFILITLAIPSLKLLFFLEEISDPSVTLKILAAQWYWTYEFSDFNRLISFDSYLIPESSLNVTSPFRLLEVDSRVQLPINTPIRLLLTSQDVLHSWAIPSLTIKVDAVPGRISEASLLIKRCGVFYGQCSELCGVNHGYMPIVIESVTIEEFIMGIKN